MMTFNAVELKVQFARTGFSIGEVAKRLGVHRNVVGAWVQGVRAPSPLQLVETLSIIGWPQSEINNMRFGLFYNVVGMKEANES